MPARPPPTTHMQMLMRRLQEVRVQTPWGKGCTYHSGTRCKPLVEVDLLAYEHPAFHPRLIYYNVPVINLISLFEANFTNYQNMQENCPNH